MIRQFSKPYLLSGIVLIALAACGPFLPNEAPSTPDNSISPDATNTSPADRNDISQPFTDQAWPDTKLARLSLEGEQSEIELHLLESESLPFITYIPQPEFTLTSDQPEDGQGLRLNFSPGGTPNPAAYVEIVIPDGRASLQDVRDRLLDEQGLLTRNGWQMVDRTEVVTYPWAVEKIVYEHQTADALIVGSIFIGENDGSAFYALTHYPSEYGDGFEPRAVMILENLEFKEQG